MQLIHLQPDDDNSIQACAALLVDVFREHSPDAWPDMEAGLEEVRECLEPGRISLIAVDEGGEVLGWIGARPEYALVWELHPLVVRQDRQRQGIGRALVADLEARVWERGGRTLRLGSDDEDHQTTLFGIDLYPDPLAHLSQIQNLGRHPFEFYQKVGFALVGVIPDATGFGRPDILMAKRIEPARP